MSCSFVSLSLLRTVTAGAIVAFGFSGAPAGALAEYGPKCPPYWMTECTTGIPDVTFRGSATEAGSDELAAVACYSFEHDPQADTSGATAGGQQNAAAETDAATTDDPYADDTNAHAYEAEHGYEYGYEDQYDQYRYEDEYEYEGRYGAYADQYGAESDASESNANSDTTEPNNEKDESHDDDTYEDDYRYGEYDTYGDEYEYGYEGGYEPYGQQYQDDTDGSENGETTDVTQSNNEDDESYDDDTYEDDYGYGEYDTYGDEGEYGYDEDEYGPYGDEYSYDYEDADSDSDSDSAEEEAPIEEVDAEGASSYDGFAHESYEDVYEYAYEDAYVYPNDEASVGTEAQPNEEQPYVSDEPRQVEEFGEYSNYYQYDAYQSRHNAEYEHAESAQQYGHRPTFVDKSSVEDIAGAVEATAEPSTDWIDISQCSPTEVLTAADLAFLRQLDDLSGETDEVRSRATQRYLDGLGSKAWRFVGFFEGFTGTDLAEVSSDVLETSMVLATIRLVERENLPRDEAASSLQGGVCCPPDHWGMCLWNILETPEVAAGVDDGVSLLDALRTWGSASFGRLEEVVGQAAQHLPKLRGNVVSLMRFGKLPGDDCGSDGMRF